MSIIVEFESEKAPTLVFLDEAPTLVVVVAYLYIIIYLRKE